MDHLVDDLYSLSEEAEAEESTRKSSSQSPIQRESSSQSPIQHDDSGYGVELSTEHTGSETTVDLAFFEQSVSTLSRSQRCRKSLRKLRERTGKFLEHRIRPSCLGLKTELDKNNTPEMSMRMKTVVTKTKSDNSENVSKISENTSEKSMVRMKTVVTNSKSDNSQNVAKISGSVRSNLKDEVDKMFLMPPGLGRRSRYQSSPAVRSPLTRQEELDLIGSLDSKRELFGCRSIRSSNSAGTLHSVDDRGVIWMNSTMNSTTESRQTSPATSTESLSDVYRQVLRCLINPLGCSDRKPGFSPTELALHLREIFQVNINIHESLIEEVKNVKPTNVVLNVTVFEARNLKPSPSIDLTNPYCTLSLDALNSPKTSPISSPRTSPTSRRKSTASVSYELSEEAMETEVLRSTINPKWNHQCELAVKDLNNDIFHLQIANSSTQSSNPDMERFRRRNGTSIRGIFRHFRLSLDNNRNTVNHLGQLHIALKDIPAVGYDTWFTLFKDRRQRYPLPAQCRLRLQLSYKHCESPELERCSVQEFHSVVQEVYKHALICTTPNANPQRLSSSILANEEFGRISERSRIILNQFAIQSTLSHLTQNVIELAVLLELKVDPSFSLLVTDKLLKEQIMSVEEECHNCHMDADLPISDIERTILDEALAAYLRTIQTDIRPNSSMFPPRDLKLEELNNQVCIPSSLLSLPLWTSVHDSSESRQTFTAIFTHRLQDDVKEWLSCRLNTIISHEKDPVIPNTRTFISILQEASTVLTPIFSITEYFLKLGFDYFKLASMTMEVKLSAKAQELAFEMDRYQLKYHRFDVNIRNSSVISLQHHFALRSVFNTIRGNVSERELFRISMSRYQEWFKSSVTFWLQTFREECEKRMEKALSLDKDVVQVAALVKYSNSSLDILSSFAKTTNEWQEIDFGDADIALLGVTKITDMICDCVKLHTEKVIAIMENNGYYDYIDNQQFDVTDQLCISLNNISHLCGYLGQLSTRLNWELVAQQLSIKHESELVGKQALVMLQSLVSCTDEEMMHTGRILAQQIIVKIAIDLRKYTMMFTRNTCTDSSKEVDPLLDYLDNNLQVLHQKLETFIFPMFLEEIWKAEIKIFTDTLMNGQSPEYYQKMLLHLVDLEKFFHSHEIEAQATASCKMYKRLLRILDTHSQGSEVLMLQYYGSLAVPECTPLEYYGHLVVKVGYSQKSEQLVNLHVNVVQAKYLPGMTHKDLSNPFVSVTLCPCTLFRGHEQKKTKIQQGTINPSYEEKFEFNDIPDEFRRTEGAVVIFSVWHSVSFMPNDFLGEVVLPLSQLSEININQGVEDIQALMMPLRRPKEPRDGPFKVLKERMVNDKTAELLVNQRYSTIAFNVPCRLCKPLKSIVSTITGKKLEVVGK